MQEYAQKKRGDGDTREAIATGTPEEPRHMKAEMSNKDSAQSFRMKHAALHSAAAAGFKAHSKGWPAENSSLLPAELAVTIDVVKQWLPDRRQSG